MFGTVKRIIDWCGSFKKNLYIGFIFSFFSGWFAAMPVVWAAYMIGKLVECEGQGKAVSTVWIGKSIVTVSYTHLSYENIDLWCWCDWILVCGFICRSRL